MLDKHRIITQVAGHNVDVVKLLPPLILTEKDAKYFLNAFEDVMVQMHKFPGPAWDVLTGIGKMAPPGVVAVALLKHAECVRKACGEPAVEPTALFGGETLFADVWFGIC